MHCKNIQCLQELLFIHVHSHIKRWVKTLGEREQEMGRILETSLLKEVMSLINFNSLVCAKDSERLQCNSCAVLLLFEYQLTDNAVNKLAIGTEGSQKLIRKPSGSLYKIMIKRKGKLRWGEIVFFGFLRQIPSDTLGSLPSQQQTDCSKKENTQQKLLCSNSNYLDGNIKQSQQLLPDKPKAEHGWISNTESAS